MSVRAIVLLGALALAGSVGAQTTNPKYIKEQNDHAKQVQQKAQAARQQDNRTVNNNIQQQRYNNTRPSTPAATRPTTTYKAPVSTYKAPTSTYKAPAPAYKAPVPVYRPPTTSSYSSSYKRK
ncbi:MAG: hypothetical protein ABI583_12390 [Betaproteobacteria bacterium]